MFFVLGVIHNYEVRVQHRKNHMLNTDLIVNHTKKSVLSTEKHMLNTDLASVNS